MFLEVRRGFELIPAVINAVLARNTQVKSPRLRDFREPMRS